MSKEKTDPSGLLLVDKPAGPTSHDVVQDARRALGEGRIGHTGTLDPFATGLLLLLIGPSTRLAEYFQDLDKAYRAVLRLGVATESHDPEGAVVSTSDEWRGLSRRRVREALDRFTGRIRQRPPAYSAKQVEGRRAHRAARAGERVALEPETVTVHELRLARWDPPRAAVECRVGSGTYVRALARDVGRELGCGAHLSELRRTAVGPFEVDGALPAGELGPDATASDAFRDPPAAVAWLPRRELDGAERDRVAHGTPVDRGELRVPSGGREPEKGAPVALLSDGELAAVAELQPEKLQPRKVFADG